MASKYRYIKAVGQYDENTCWAASLEWWMRAMNLGEIYQDWLSTDYLLMRGDGGSINMDGIIQLIEDPRWYMKWIPYYAGREFTAERIRGLLSSGPMYVGYYSQKLRSNHVNVIYGISGSGSNAKVHAMEPHGTPIPGDDPGYKGKHVTRNLYKYTTGAVHVGVLRGSSSAGTGYDESYYY